MQEEKVLFNATLCFPIRGRQVLLGRKMKKIGQGRLNGWGGGIENGETPEESIIRELEEEAKIHALPSGLEKVGIVDFHNTNSDRTVFVCRVHVFFLHQWEGEAQPTDEVIDPKWFDIGNLPLDEMMLADKIWLPMVLAGRKITAEAHYGPFQKSLLGEVKVQYVHSFS
jgi:8-oxo-dGTP diphosphatase